MNELTAEIENLDMSVEFKKFDMSVEFSIDTNPQVIIPYLLAENGNIILTEDGLYIKV